MRNSTTPPAQHRGAYRAPAIRPHDRHNLRCASCGLRRPLRQRLPGSCADQDGGYSARMVDLLLRNARLAGSEPVTDLGVSDGRLVFDPGAEARDTIDLGGRLVTPPLVEPHIH